MRKAAYYICFESLSEQLCFSPEDGRFAFYYYICLIPLVSKQMEDLQKFIVYGSSLFLFRHL